MKLAPGEFIGTPELRLATRSGVIAVIGQQARIEPHEHSDTHLVMVTQGIYRTGAAGADGYAGQGCVLINPPGTRHDDQFEGPGRLVTFSLSDALLESFGGKGLRCERASAVKRAAPVALLTRVAREAACCDETSELEIEGLALEVLAELSGYREADRVEPRWLARVEELMVAGDISSLKALALEAGVHPVHLTRSFRKFRGQTPGTIMRRARAKRAAAMLARSREAISSIALECGFADQAAFTKAFTRATAMSPHAFRRRWRH